MNYECSDQTLVNLGRKFPNLKSLELKCTVVGGAPLLNFQGCFEQLEKLDIEESNFGSADALLIALIGAMPKLNELKIKRFPQPTHLLSLPKLRNLQISAFYLDEDDCLPHLGDLKDLRLSSCIFPVIVFDAIINKLPNIKLLSLVTFADRVPEVAKRVKPLQNLELIEIQSKPTKKISRMFGIEAIHFTEFYA